MTDQVEIGLQKIRENPDGVLQSDLWKLLGVDSRKCSRIVKKLLDTGLIERNEVKQEGIKTFILRAKKSPFEPSCILAGESLIPCIGCDEECIVIECPLLLEWMFELALEGV